jgi:TonB family protein
MKRVGPSLAWSVLTVALTFAGAGPALAQIAADTANVTPAAPDTIATARALYASAAYEESLAVLNRLMAAGQPSEQETTIEQYRAFCLLALGRNDDAERAIEAIVRADPAYRPSETDMSPRVQMAFSTVRQRMLPGIIEQQYTDAKAAFDKKDYAGAAKGFRGVLALLRDPDIGAAASEPPLSDLGTLADGFRELSAKALAPPPPPPAPAAAAPVPPQPAVPAAPRIYATGEPDVVPPVTLRQNLPAFTGARTPSTPGELEVVINEQGRVESAAMRASVNPSYDREALTAASRWRYRPATVNGQPVKFRKIIQIDFKPAS